LLNSSGITPDAIIEEIKTYLIQMSKNHNYLIDILSKQIKILEAEVANGITVTTVGKVTLGLASATTAGAISPADWIVFDGKQDHSTELDAFSALADTAGFVKKTGDSAYAIDTNTYMTAGDSIVYAIALG
jgi:hypothetical protein